MANRAAFEECPRPYAACPVDYLVGDEEISRFDFFFKATYRAKSNAAADTKLTECSYVGSTVDFVGSDIVM